MKNRKVDVAVIGMASAGINAYRAAKQAGASCVVIDKGPLGTTCARVGCMPSKLLIAAADACYHFHHAEEFGLELDGKVKILGEKVMGRVQRIRNEFVSGVIKKTELVPKEDKIIGFAKFVGPNILEIDKHIQIEADTIVIAAGGETYIPPILKKAEERLLTNEEIFELPTVPESLFVVGMGLIGMELGQSFARLGTRTVFLDLYRVIAGLSDPDIQNAAFDIFRNELNLHAPANILSVKKAGDKVKVTYKSEDGQSHEDYFEYILCAAGHPPQIKNLCLEKTGLLLDDHGMPPYDPETCQCSDSHIFMAGDVTGQRQLLHEAIDEGIHAGMNAANFPEVASFMRRTPLAIAFTDPQISCFGKMYRDFGVNKPPRIAVVDYKIDDRSRIMNINRGLGHIYIDTDDTILGGEIIGPRAENIGHLLSWSIQQRMKIRDILKMPFYHPAFEESIKDALISFLDKHA